MTEARHTFKQGLNKIIVKPVKEPGQELTPMEMLNVITNMRNNIMQHEEAIKQAGDAKKQAEEALEQVRADVQAAEKFEQWALDRQHSKLRVLVSELHDKVVAKVNDVYREDVTLDADQNKRQRFVQYRGYIASDPAVAENIAAEVIKDKLYVNCDLKNPWGPDFVAPVAPVEETEEVEVTVTE